MALPNPTGAARWGSVFRHFNPAFEIAI